MAQASMTARRIIRTYLGIAASTTLAQSLIWGINTLFLLVVGLDIFQVMLVNAAYTVAQVFFEVPTGVIADTVGRRVSYLLAVGIVLCLDAAVPVVRTGRARRRSVRRRVGAAGTRLHLLHRRRGRLDGRRPALGRLPGQARAHLRPLRHGLRRLHADRHHRRRLPRAARPVDPLRAARRHPRARVPARGGRDARPRLQGPAAHARQLRPRDAAHRHGRRHLRPARPCRALHHAAPRSCRASSSCTASTRGRSTSSTCWGRTSCG